MVNKMDSMKQMCRKGVYMPLLNSIISFHLYNHYTRPSHLCLLLELII